LSESPDVSPTVRYVVSLELCIPASGILARECHPYLNLNAILTFRCYTVDTKERGE